MTFQTKGVESTNEPPCPVFISLQGFYCFIIFLLRHCSVLGFDCLLRCLFRHYTISLCRAWFNMWSDELKCAIVKGCLCSKDRLSSGGNKQLYVIQSKLWCE